MKYIKCVLLASGLLNAGVAYTADHSLVLGSTTDPDYIQSTISSQSNPNFKSFFTNQLNATINNTTASADFNSIVPDKDIHPSFMPTTNQPVIPSIYSPTAQPSIQIPSSFTKKPNPGIGQRQPTSPPTTSKSPSITNSPTYQPTLRSSPVSLEPSANPSSSSSSLPSISPSYYFPTLLPTELSTSASSSLTTTATLEPSLQPSFQPSSIQPPIQEASVSFIFVKQVLENITGDVFNLENGGSVSIEKNAAAAIHSFKMTVFTCLQGKGNGSQIVYSDIVVVNITEDDISNNSKDTTSLLSLLSSAVTTTRRLLPYTDLNTKKYQQHIYVRSLAALSSSSAVSISYQLLLSNSTNITSIMNESNSIQSQLDSAISSGRFMAVFRTNNQLFNVTGLDNVVAAQLPVYTTTVVNINMIPTLSPILQPSLTTTIDTTQQATQMIAVTTAAVIISLIIFASVLLIFYYCYKTSQDGDDDDHEKVKQRQHFYFNEKGDFCVAGQDDNNNNKIYDHYDNDSGTGGKHKSYSRNHTKDLIRQQQQQQQLEDITAKEFMSELEFQYSINNGGYDNSNRGFHNHSGRSETETNYSHNNAIVDMAFHDPNSATSPIAVPPPVVPFVHQEVRLEDGTMAILPIPIVIPTPHTNRRSSRRNQRSNKNNSHTYGHSADSSDGSGRRSSGRRSYKSVKYTIGTSQSCDVMPNAQLNSNNISAPDTALSYSSNNISTGGSDSNNSSRTISSATSITAASTTTSITAPRVVSLNPSRSSRLLSAYSMVDRMPSTILELDDENGDDNDIEGESDILPSVLMSATAPSSLSPPLHNEHEVSHNTANKTTNIPAVVAATPTESAAVVQSNNASQAASSLPPLVLPPPPPPYTPVQLELIKQRVANKIISMSDNHNTVAHSTTPDKATDTSTSTIVYTLQPPPQSSSPSSASSSSFSDGVEGIPVAAVNTQQQPLPIIEEANIITDNSMYEALPYEMLPFQPITSTNNSPSPTNHSPTNNNSNSKSAKAFFSYVAASLSSKSNNNSPTRSVNISNSRNNSKNNSPTKKATTGNNKASSSSISPIRRTPPALALGSLNLLNNNSNNSLNNYSSSTAGTSSTSIYSSRSPRVGLTGATPRSGTSDTPRSVRSLTSARSIYSLHSNSNSGSSSSSMTPRSLGGDTPRFLITPRSNSSNMSSPRLLSLRERIVDVVLSNSHDNDDPPDDDMNSNNNNNTLMSGKNSSSSLSSSSLSSYKNISNAYITSPRSVYMRTQQQQQQQQQIYTEPAVNISSRQQLHVLSASPSTSNINHHGPDDSDHDDEDHDDDNDNKTTGTRKGKSAKTLQSAFRSFRQQSSSSGTTSRSMKCLSPR